MLADYDFKYTGIMKSSMESIPIGNGDLGANIWAEKDGIYFLLSKTDAFSRLHRLLKTGFLKFTLPDSRCFDSLDFHLSLEEGILKIKNEDISFQIYADANSPVYVMDISGDIGGCSLSIINYRSEPEKIDPADRSNYQLNHDKNTHIDFDCTEDADIVFSAGEGTLGQYHRNSESLYKFSLKYQHLEDYEGNDPLTGLTFGFLAFTPDADVKGESLQFKPGTKNTRVIIHSLCEKCGKPEEFTDKIKNIPETDREKHISYWKDQWNKSYVYMSGSKKAEKLTQGYILQRYMNICAGRGKYPIKFNGSIFTCQPSPHRKENMDYRNWGGYYWLQNTRLIYWNMLYSGDYELMLPFFRLYTDNLNFAKYRTQKYFGYEGAFYPETMSIFAAYADTNYGWNRDSLEDGVTENTYIRYYYCGALEVSLMMLLYCRNSGDSEFLKEECLPFVYENLRFFKNRFTLPDGSMKFQPTSSLETWQNCIDDSPNIAGLKAVCEALKTFSEASEKLKEFADSILKALPKLPIGKKGFKKVVLPFSENVDKVKRNCENPELYTVFPYGIYKIGEEDLDIGINTFKKRKEKASCGWQQHGIQAAFLGLKKETFKEIIRNCENTNKNCIFPSFYGPNYDWLPDQDNGSVMNIAITKALVQSNSEKIFLFPAWDKKLSVSFRLPIDDNFITVKYERGRKPEYSFDKPESREVVIM